MADSGLVETVYNLEVEDDHTYFVGCGEWKWDVWSHNADGCAGKVKAGATAAQKRKTYQTYTKTNLATGEVYVGRISGTGTPLENLARREGAGHDWTPRGFGKPVLDKSSTSCAAVRGREQQLKDYYARIGKKAAQDEPISPRNKNRAKYLAAGRRVFGVP